MRYRIIERRKTLFALDDEDAEFGKVHPSQRVYEIETVTWPPKLIKAFTSFQGAKAWAKGNKIEIGEIA